MNWVRIDNRLVHGQVIEAWLPFTGASMIIVANDELAVDALRQEIMAMAIPEGVELVFSRVNEVAGNIEQTYRDAGVDALVLFASCGDARKAHEKGMGIVQLNIGNLHYGPGKRQLCPHVAISDEDEACLDYFSEQGIRLDFRCVPNDTVQVRSFK